MLECPLTVTFLMRLCADLGASSINIDLLEEANALFSAADTGATQERVSYCCRLAIERLAANLRREAPQPVPLHCPMDAARIAQVLKVMDPLMEHHNIEFAEYAMGVEQRDATQLAQAENRTQRRQVVEVRRMLHALQENNAAAVGEYFYAFMYRDLQDVEALVSWAKRLVEMKKHGE